MARRKTTAPATAAAVIDVADSEKTFDQCKRALKAVGPYTRERIIRALIVIFGVVIQPSNHLGRPENPPRTNDPPEQPLEPGEVRGDLVKQTVSMIRKIEKCSESGRVWVVKLLANWYDISLWTQPELIPSNTGDAKWQRTEPAAAPQETGTCETSYIPAIEDDDPFASLGGDAEEEEEEQEEETDEEEEATDEDDDADPFDGLA